MSAKWLVWFVLLATVLGAAAPADADQKTVVRDPIQSTNEISAWQSVSQINAPAARYWHTATWTGSEMIVFGGIGEDPYRYLNDGGSYDPDANSWTVLPLIGAPSRRIMHTAVWTGSEMIIWGGFGEDTQGDGARFNPQTNQWTPISMEGAPSPRYSHTAVWTGSEMIIWG